MMSRGSSGQTVQGGLAVPPSPRPSYVSPRRPSYQRPSKIEAIMQDTSDPSHPVSGRSVSPSPLDKNPDGSSSSESENEMRTAHSQAFKRPPPHFSSRPRTGTYRGQEDDDDEDDSPAFLPINELPTATTAEKAKSPLVDSRHLETTSRRSTPTSHERQRIQPQTTTYSSGSSTSSHPASLPATEPGPGPTQQRRPRGPLSPRQTAELVSLAGRSSRRQHQHGPSKPGSDGTPSMGSSFSDLDGTVRPLTSSFSSCLPIDSDVRLPFSRYQRDSVSPRRGSVE